MGAGAYVPAVKFSSSMLKYLLLTSNVSKRGSDASNMTDIIEAIPNASNFFPNTSNFYRTFRTSLISFEDVKSGVNMAISGGACEIFFEHVESCLSSSSASQVMRRLQIRLSVLEPVEDFSDLSNHSRTCRSSFKSTDYFSNMPSTFRSSLSFSSTSILPRTYLGGTCPRISFSLIEPVYLCLNLCIFV